MTFLVLLWLQLFVAFIGATALEINRIHNITIPEFARLISLAG